VKRSGAWWSFIDDRKAGRFAELHVHVRICYATSVSTLVEIFFLVDVCVHGGKLLHLLLRMWGFGFLLALGFT
jgi:hypothetical protein